MKLCYEFDCTVVDVQMCIEDLFDKLAICMCPYIWNWSMSPTCRRSPYCTGKGVNHNRMTDSNWVSSSGGFTWSGDPRRASYHFTTQAHTCRYDGKESSLLQIFCWRSKSTIFANIGWSQDSKEKHTFLLKLFGNYSLHLPSVNATDYVYNIQALFELWMCNLTWVWCIVICV